jgi:hypothetical protein
VTTTAIPSTFTKALLETTGSIKTSTWSESQSESDEQDDNFLFYRQKFLPNRSAAIFSRNQLNNFIIKTSTSCLGALLFVAFIFNS